MKGFKNAALAALAATTFWACSPNATSAPVNGTDGGNHGTPPIDPGNFVTPNLTAAQIQTIMAKYTYVDKTHIIPANLLQDAIVYYDYNLALIGNAKVLSIVDFTLYNGKQRFHVIDMATGAIASTWVAHGIGSDPNWTGYAKTFSNTPNSNQSSLGFFLTAETYQGDNGYSERMDGLSTTNSNARFRDIVIHSASYVTDQDTLQGRSDGCFAFSEADGTNMINQLLGGSIIYAGLEGQTMIEAVRDDVADPNPMAYPALWEAAQPQGTQWSIYAYNAVATYGSGLMKGAADMNNYCPKYASLNSNQQITFWVYLVSAVSKFESGFDFTDRYVETTLGIDPITGQQVVSEGLLQLSYQDVLTYPYCNQFNWATDKSLDPENPAKTIFDPNMNLTCGIRILNQQVSTNNAIAYAGYWSTLFPSGKHSKVSDIQALAKQIPFCW